MIENLKILNGRPFYLIVEDNGIRELSVEEIEDIPSLLSFYGLDIISEAEFKHLWIKCMIGSKNTPSLLTIDEHFEGLKQELGAKYKESCLAVYEQGEPIGIVIPHIEPGTTEEGRLFYIGLLPEKRKQGKGSLIHKEALAFLKRIGASYYIGSTNEQNVPMIRIFEKNKCTIKNPMVSYYLILRD